MSFNLVRDNESDEWSTRYWWRVLDLATKYGWEPEGTKPPMTNNDKWDGNYVTNQGQMVTESDAKNLASALEKACEQLPNEYQPIPNFQEYTETDGKCDQTVPIENFFSGGKKQGVERFIKFCKNGAFFIK